MINRKRLRQSVPILATVFVLVLGACSSSNESATDAVITAKVKQALAENKSVPASQITVTTSQGNVRLNGVIGSPASELEAIQVTKQVQGVQTVDDKLIVNSNSK